MGSCLYEKEQYDGINEEVSIEENNVLVKFLYLIDPSVYLHWSVIEVKWMLGPSKSQITIVLDSDLTLQGALILS